MSKYIATYKSEGFTCEVTQLDDLSVPFLADADIDADGANGQRGGRAAYMVDNMGSELLANGGMKMQNGIVVFAEPWGRDIVIHEEGARGPSIFSDNIVASKTAYRFRNKAEDDPSAYVDSETVPYVCVPPQIRELAKGYVLGCLAKVRHTLTGKIGWGMVADIGPRSKIGEISIAMARLVGVNPSPRVGGEEKPLIEYTIYPNQFFTLNNVILPLISMKGDYISPVELDGHFTKIE